MSGERGVKGDSALRAQRRGGAVMDGGRRHQPDPAVPMFVVTS